MTILWVTLLYIGLIGGVIVYLVWDLRRAVMRQREWEVWAAENLTPEERQKAIDVEWLCWGFPPLRRSRNV